MGFGRRAQQIGGYTLLLRLGHSHIVAPSLLLTSCLVLLDAGFQWHLLIKGLTGGEGQKNTDQHTFMSCHLGGWMCSTLPPTSWSPRSLSRHNRSAHFLCPLHWRPGCNICCSYNLPSAFLRKWSEQLNQQNQPFPPGPRQPPWPGNRWRRGTGLSSRRPTLDRESQCDQPPR